MGLQLDHNSPVPLYHQLAEAIRYRIATGALLPGSVLPALRRAAVLWGVNLHTVRRAYVELEAQGLVATKGTLGTQVLSPAGGRAAARPSARDRFLSRTLKEAREKHGLEPGDLAALLKQRKQAVQAGDAKIFVTECSRTQCEDLAAQIEARWKAAAVPWPLDREDAPPGVILATYFHYNDVRLRWPARFAEVRFAAISPDPELRGRLRPRARTGTPKIGKRTQVLLCEREPAMLQNIAADLSRILPEEEFQVLAEVVDRPESLLAGTRTRTPILFAPRMWGRLSEEARNDPRAHEVRYVFDPKDLEELGRDLGWQERG